MATSMRAILTVPVNDRDHVQGPADAPVTLVKYGDFECPYCAAAHVIVKKVQEIMADQLRFVFRTSRSPKFTRMRNLPLRLQKRPGRRVSFGKCMTSCMRTNPCLIRTT